MSAAAQQMKARIGKLQEDVAGLKAALDELLEPHNVAQAARIGALLEDVEGLRAAIAEWLEPQSEAWFEIGGFADRLTRELYTWRAEVGGPPVEQAPTQSLALS